MTEFVGVLHRLYTGRNATAARFRFCLLAVDLLTISYFVALSMTDLRNGWITTIDYVIAAYLIADLTARALIERRRLAFFGRPSTLLDLAVIGSLLISPLVESLAFLRVLRTLRLLQSYHMLLDLRARYAFFKRNESIIAAALNLIVFIFVVAALVLVFQIRGNPQINNYLDALYFTVSTLTTTGFGDIVLIGNWGRLLAVVIMIVGVGLFVRLLQAIFRPDHVKHTCPDCGLKEHDRDAVHCKHCGRTINIETEGI